MKKLLTLVLLVISLLASGQSNSQSLEVEIKYWKSIAESNDTVAYREYLQRYGEDGLYKDEALTRITLLKSSGKQVQSKCIECCFYSQTTRPVDVRYVVRFDGNQSKVWLKDLNSSNISDDRYHIVRSNLSISRDFYEDQTTITLLRGTRQYENAISNDKEALEKAEYARKHEKNRRKKAEILQKAEQAKSPDYYINAWTTDEKYKFDPMKSTSAKDVYFKQDKLHEIEHNSRGNGFSCKRFFVYSSDPFNNHYYEKRSYHDDYSNACESYKTIKTMQGYRYIAISKDKSSIIMWFEDEDNLDGVIYEKREYKRIPKEELLPKAVNYDFLNE